MANFVVVIDPDAERRSRFVEKVMPMLSPVEGLVTATCSTGDFSAIWATEREAPVSHAADDKGASVVWGDAIDGPGDGRVDAAALRQAWKEPSSCPELVFDGFYAAVVYHPDFGLTVGADLLGIFPIYHYSSEEVVLVGSSPELFRYHPSFRMEFNPKGLVGILLTMHIFDGETLLRGVNRLAAGHVLVWRPDAQPKEVCQYELPVSNKYFDLPYSAHVDILGRTLDEAVSRHVPAGRRYAQLFSGGLDSRILGGYLKEKDVDVVALTLGLHSDIEMKCAIPVVRALGFESRTANIGHEQYPFCADVQAKWEHVANGFNFMMNWGVYPHLRELGEAVVAGFMMDAAVGTTWIEKAYVPSSDTASFDAFFSHVNSWGLRRDVLKRLLRREVFGDLVDETLSRIRAVYEGYSELESQRAWCFNLRHRQRFHVGGMAWGLAFGAWPTLPALDRRVLEAGGGMPAATIGERRAEKELLCTRFPRLAGLPLDHNSYDPEPLRPRLRREIVQHLYWQLKPLRRLRDSMRRRKGEHRYYFRIYDFNGPGWMAVRARAEAYRERVQHLFHKEVLDELLPGPGVPVSFGNSITEASGLKSLLGLMLWSKEHL
jgi:asparagine synthase (glutamine-hydrolysing)